MNKQKKTRVWVLIGPMGCGKTTVGKVLSRKLGWPFYDGDDFHPPENVEKMRRGVPLNDEDRKPWLTILRKEIDTWLQSGQSALLACSALKRQYRDMLGIDQKKVISVYLKGSYALLQKRIGSRRHPYMNTALLQSQIDAMQEPQDGLTVDISPTPDKIADTIIHAIAGE
jgi:carbohydrate kinase (thermoresistant glucokinase family)